MDYLFNALSSLAVAGVLGIIAWNFRQRDDLNGIRLELVQAQLEMARTYASKSDHNELKATLHEIAQEMKSMYEILCEVRSDLRAGNLTSRT